MSVAKLMNISLDNSFRMGVGWGKYQKARVTSSKYDALTSTQSRVTSQPKYETLNWAEKIPFEKPAARE